MAEVIDSMKSRPDDMASHYNLGNFYMARSQMPDAVTEFETATRLQPEAPAALRERRPRLQRAGPERQGRSQPAPCAQPRPHQRRRQPEPRHVAGRGGQDARGRTGIPRRVQSRPQVRPGRLQPRHPARPKTSPRKRSPGRRRAAELRPDNPQYGYTYAFYLYRAGQLDEALKAIRLVRQRFPTHEDSLLFERQLRQEQTRRRSDAKAAVIG